MTSAKSVLSWKRNEDDTFEQNILNITIIADWFFLFKNDWRILHSLAFLNNVIIITTKDFLSQT